MIAQIDYATLWFRTLKSGRPLDMSEADIITGDSDIGKVGGSAQRIYIRDVQEGMCLAFCTPDGWVAGDTTETSDGDYAVEVTWDTGYSKTYLLEDDSYIYYLLAMDFIIN